MLEGAISKFVGKGLFPEKELHKIVHKHAAIAALVLILPLFGLDWIFYIWCLWHMYTSLSKKVGANFNFSNIIIGLIINMVITVVIDIVFTLLPYITGFVVYLQFYLSGKSYIETLRKLDLAPKSINTKLPPKAISSPPPLMNSNPKDKELAESNESEATNKLIELKALLDSNAITQEEYEKIKKS